MISTAAARPALTAILARRLVSNDARRISEISDDVADLVEEYYAKSPTSISLQTLMKTGRGELLRKTYKDSDDRLERQLESERILVQVASFIRREMPIRLAHRIHDLDRVPMMRDMPSVQAVKGIYINSFLELVDQPKIENKYDEEDFAITLENLYQNHSNVLIQMAQGAYELREAVRTGQIPGKITGDVEFARMKECHEFLDRFYMTRIGIRVLAGQYLALRGPPLRSYVGMICSQTSPFEIVRHAANDATMMCTRMYGTAPEVVIKGRLDLTFAYIPTHLHYILLELLKNAMRATVEKHGDYSHLPPVVVIIADSPDNEDIVIKVADEGGGIPRSQIDKIWSYLFTTADPQIQQGFIGGGDHSSDSPLAGLGYGLPISRSYARYFGGDLDIMSMEGYGTDAFVHLARLGDSQEPLEV
ncbi:Mitochondrial branched-chain alpha-ketoacid dehydrogenase kinase [Fragilaria crotonensis]|nr:Mitochondrial branched-chain alpha-ketoacid dehydrogenase kinase [Fragilaria crotonensis]